MKIPYSPLSSLATSRDTYSGEMLCLCLLTSPLKLISKLNGSGSIKAPKNKTPINSIPGLLDIPDYLLSTVSLMKRSPLQLASISPNCFKASSSALFGAGNCSDFVFTLLDQDFNVLPLFPEIYRAHSLGASSRRLLVSE